MSLITGSQLFTEMLSERSIPSPSTREGEDGGAAHAVENSGHPFLSPSPSRGRRQETFAERWFAVLRAIIISILFIFSTQQHQTLAADRVRFAYPAKSLNYLPITLGREKGIFQGENIDLQMVLVTSTIQVSALTTGDID